MSLSRTSNYYEDIHPTPPILPTFSYSQIDEDKYDYIGDFWEKGYASWALVRNGELYGFIDRQGKEIVKLEFKKMYSFGSS